MTECSLDIRYRQYLDPSVDETKKFCCLLRRNATDERVLFHYNGHGVPKPTPSGEIWVFNRNFTQYIPISLYDLQTWLGAPGIFVYDCADAGTIIHNFNRFIERHEAENAEIRQRDPSAQVMDYSDCIQLGACAMKESLPTNPHLPADLFTSCLTTPIDISLRFFVLQSTLPSPITIEDAAKIPGRLQDRRSPLGELNWIFTAITDTIAWNTLPPAVFRRLFRQDLMVAALFRNFLLSQRIMRVYQCHPQSSPVLPETYRHPLWESWDLALEMALTQLPALLEAQEGRRSYEYQHSTFFTEQLTAFEVYLTQCAATRKAPDQLPIVLQVLMSQVHRLRALILLSRFLDLGPWAVNLALSIGIFTYVLRLLQSQAAELRPVLVFIWARILAVDQACQTELLKDSGYKYFVNILEPQAGMPITNVSEHRAMCAFIIAMFCKDFHQGQTVCLEPVVMTACLAHLKNKENSLLRQWACLCISQLWVDYPEAKWLGIRELVPQGLCELTSDPIPEVRAAMLYALNTFLGIPEITDQVARIEENLAWTILPMTIDCSSVVRKELLVFFSTFVKRYENNFVVAAYEHLVAEVKDAVLPGAHLVPGRNIEQPTARATMRPPGKRMVRFAGEMISHNTIFAVLWKHALIMSVDPHPAVANCAMIIVDYVYTSLLDSQLARPAQRMLDILVSVSKRAPPRSRPATADGPLGKQDTQLGQSPVHREREGDAPAGIRRSASIAAALRGLTFGPSNHNASLGQIREESLATGLGPRQLPGPRGNRTPAEWRAPPDQNDQLPLHSTYHQAKMPLPPRFKPRNKTQAPDLPLKSKFLEFSSEVCPPSNNV